MEATLPRDLAGASARTQGKTPPFQAPASTSRTGRFKALASGKQGRDGLRPRRKPALPWVISGRPGGGAGQDGDDETQNDHDSGYGGVVDQQQHQGLACPFYRLNTMRHMSCSWLRLSRIRDVKQHLIRRHCQPLYCPVCGDIFDNPQPRDSHIMARACHPPPGGVSVDIEGVTLTQRTALSRRVDRGLDEASQWFSVWEILFPNFPRPRSPYLSTEYGGEVLDIVQDYWQRHKDTLVAEVVQSASTGSDENRRLVTQLSSQAIANLFSSFRTTSQCIMNSASPNRSIPTLRGCVGLAPLVPAPRHGGPAIINDGEQTSSNLVILNPGTTPPPLHFPRPVSSPIQPSQASPPNPYSQPHEFYTPPAIPGIQFVEPLGTSLSTQAGSGLAVDYLGEFVDHDDFPHARATVTDGDSVMGLWAGAQQATTVVDLLQEWRYEDLHQ